MTVWKAGMLAVKVSGPCQDMPKCTVARVTEVVGVGRGEYTDKISPSLVLEGWPHEGHYIGWASHNFRPAVQDWQSKKQSKASKLDDMLKGRIPA